MKHGKTNNRADNLEVVTQRKNANKKHIKSSSQYIGVTWSKSAKKWISTAIIDGKKVYNGLFLNELDAHNAYLESVENNASSKKPIVKPIIKSNMKEVKSLRKAVGMSQGVLADYLNVSQSNYANIENEKVVTHKVPEIKKRALKILMPLLDAKILQSEMALENLKTYKQHFGFVSEVIN